MKQDIERREPEGFIDYLSLAITTVGVGYLPLAPGTWGSAVGVVIYLVVYKLVFLYAGLITTHNPKFFAFNAAIPAVLSLLFVLFCLFGIWASGRAISLLGNTDPSEAVIDEVMGQLVVFFFVPFGITWPFVLTGFLLFRLFDIWKPYPIDALQILPGGLGICADDLVAGVYAGVCLAAGYAVYLTI
jgi:phosphatidylglycerophosphatase A